MIILPPPQPAAQASGFLQRWWLAGLIVLVLLAILVPKAKHEAKLWYSKEYRQQVRMDREDAQDRARKEQYVEDLTARHSDWEKANPGKVIERPYYRTYIAQIPQGVAALQRRVDGVLAGDGRNLTHRDLLRMRVNPELPPIEGHGNPHLLANARWRKLLWSNGVVTDLLGGTNLPGSRYNYATSQFIYSEDFPPPPSSNPIYELLAPPFLIRDAIAVSSTFESNFSLILRKDGSVWADGGNEYGQQGTDAPSYSGVSQPVRGLKGAVAIATGARHALALTQDGRVWQWGQDDLPYGFWNYDKAQNDYRWREVRAETGFNPTAQPVEGLGDVIKIAAGGTTSFALDRQGSVWVWGGASICKLIPVAPKPFAECPASDSDNRNYITSLCMLFSVAPDQLGLKRPVTHDGRMDPIIVAQPYRIPELRDIVDIKVVETHALALRKDGTVWAWGCNEIHEIGQAEFKKDRATGIYMRDRTGLNGVIERPRPMLGVDHVKKIFTDNGFSAVLKEDNSLWFIGEGCRLCDERIAAEYSYALKVKDGTQGTRLLEFEASYPLSTEWGIYWIDDSAGRVNGIAPWEVGYAQAALGSGRATTIFDKVVPNGTKKRFEAKSGQLFAMYIISGGTLAQWHASNPGNASNQQPVAYFSFPMPNPNQMDPASTSIYPDGKQNRISVKWHAPLHPDSPSMGGEAIGRDVYVRGVRNLLYEELPNHRDQ